LRDLFERVPSLGKPSTATSKSGRRKARSAPRADKSISARSADPHDLATLRRLYGGDEKWPMESRKVSSD
jgi:hypothetical protein